MMVRVRPFLGEDFYRDADVALGTAAASPYVVTSNTAAVSADARSVHAITMGRAGNNENLSSRRHHYERFQAPAGLCGTVCDANPK